MTKLEKNFILFIEKHYKKICFIALVLASLLVRYLCSWYVSRDAQSCLIPWYDTIKAMGKDALSEQVGNYNMLYQAIIALFTLLPLDGLHCYKILSIGFDYLLAIVIALIIYNIAETRKGEKAMLGFIATVLSPLVIMDSAIWAQCDSIYVFFLCCMLLCMMKEKYVLSFVFLGIAFAFKLQAIFILPFIILLYLHKKKFTIFNFLLVPITMILLVIPNLLSGRTIADVFLIYSEQVGEYPAVSMNYPSALLVLTNANSVGKVYNIITYCSYVMLFCYFVFLYAYTKKKEINFSKRNMIYLAFLTTYSCVLVLPSMHERYGYLYEVLAIVILIINRKTWFPFMVLYALFSHMYARFLFSVVDLPMNNIFGIINIGVYILYNIILWKQMLNEKTEDYS